MAPEKSEILPQGWPSGARLPSCSERWALEAASEERKEALRLLLRLESQEQLGQFPSQKPSISSEPVVFHGRLSFCSSVIHSLDKHSLPLQGTMDPVWGKKNYM